MNIFETDLSGVVIIEPDVFSDQRGFFLETWQVDRYKEAGIKNPFVQDNLSKSVKGTLRGLHYQSPHEQGKLVQVVSGEIYDVAVDVRVGSPTFGVWVGVVLSSDNKRQFYIPEGFAHGFCVTSDEAIFTYKCTDLYSPGSEGGVFWADPELGIDWPVTSPVLSEKDKQYPSLSNINPELLPKYKD